MRWMLIALLVGCGGRETFLGEHHWRAERLNFTGACGSMSEAFDVTATGAYSGSNFTLSGTENGAAFSAAGGSESAATWLIEGPPTVTHYYQWDSDPVLLIARIGECYAKYALR